MSSRRFGVFSNVLAIKRANGKFVLAGRQISGMVAHGRHWNGPLTCVCEPAPEARLQEDVDRLLGGDNLEVDQADLPFDLVVADFESDEARQALSSMTAAVAGIGYRATHLSRWGQELGVPVVYGSEYSLRTRLQIVHAETSNPIKRLRRTIWERNLERRQQAAIRIAAGVQCNGTPTYDAYRRINDHAMLFFDGRLGDEMLVGEDKQDARHARLTSEEPLRLAWSGRINRMKGAHHIPKIAQEIRKTGVPFTFDVFGDGVLLDDLRAETAAMGLDDILTFHGFVDYYKELTPFMQREVDIWVCPHVQGDPAGAYMEALGNGTPILGFDNEALNGLLARVDAGCIVPIGDATALAQEVALAHRNRDRIKSWSDTGRSYAAEHTFEKSFARRMEHIDSLLIQNSARPAASR